MQESNFQSNSDPLSNSYRIVIPGRPCTMKYTLQKCSLAIVWSFDWRDQLSFSLKDEPAIGERRKQDTRTKSIRTIGNNCCLPLFPTWNAFNGLKYICWNFLYDSVPFDTSGSQITCLEGLRNACSLVDASSSHCGHELNDSLNNMWKFSWQLPRYGAWWPLSPTSSPI